MKRFRVFCTHGIDAKMHEKPEFQAWVIECLHRFMNGDFGTVDPGTNDEADSMGAYSTGLGHIVIWIKRSFNVVTVMFPWED